MSMRFKTNLRIASRFRIYFDLQETQCLCFSETMQLSVDDIETLEIFIFNYICIQ